MAKLEISENCHNILRILDKNFFFNHAINQSMINNLNNEHRFGAGFRPFFLSTAPNLCLLFIQQGEKK